MSQSQIRSACLSAEPELDQILGWFTAEASIDKGAPAKLWDGRTWHRSVLEKSRAFSIPCPWLSLLCAGHIPEVFKATVKDAFGLRQRLTVAFDRPSWLSINQIRTACMKLPVASHTPEDYLAGLLYPIFANSVKRPGGKVFKPATADGAAKAVDEKFDTHMELQQASLLVVSYV